MMPCCSVSLFKLKFKASTCSTPRTPPFFRRTVSLRISPMGTKRCVELKMFFLRSRTVLFGSLMMFFKFMLRFLHHVFLCFQHLVIGTVQDGTEFFDAFTALVCRRL